MKKLAALFLSTWLVLSLAACGNQGSSDASDEAAVAGAAQKTTREETTQEMSEQPDVKETEMATETVTEDVTEEAVTEDAKAEPAGEAKGKTLVVYYSATGNTEEVANYIAAATGADVFELEPVEPYSDADLNWTDENSRVVYEHDNPGERVVELQASTVPDWDSYDTVFIGYPIWWGIAAWPVDGFIAANDFMGKTVIPFCTSSSSGLGESGELLEKAAGTGDWLEGERFSSGTSKETVQEWIEGLGI